MFWLQEQLGGDDILYVNVGIAIWLATILVRQTAMRDRRNLLPLLALEIANELIDFLDRNGGWAMGDTVMDIVLSLLWPAIITEVARTRPKSRVINKIRRPGSEPSFAKPAAETVTTVLPPAHRKSAS
jgi:hypothetical protein